MEVKYIKFESSNCVGCKKLTNALNLLGKLKDIESFDIGTDEGMDKAQEYGVRSVPVFIRLENGIEADRMTNFSVPTFKRVMGD